MRGWGHLENTEGSSGGLTLASGGLGPGLGWRQCGAGLSLAGAGAVAIGGAGAFTELLEAGSAAALLPATVLCHDVVVAAVVTEDAATYPGDQTSTGCEDAALWASHTKTGSLLGSGRQWLPSNLALPPLQCETFWPI